MIPKLLLQEGRDTIAFQLTSMYKFSFGMRLQLADNLSFN